jgi:hypothetical protein
MEMNILKPNSIGHRKDGVEYYLLLRNDPDCLKGGVCDIFLSCS